MAKLDQETKDCLLCRRVEFNEIALNCFILWGDETRARKIAIKAAELIRDTYKKNPPLLCGKSPKTIIAATIYMAQFLFVELEDGGFPQIIISKSVGVSNQALRSVYHQIASCLNLMFEPVPRSVKCSECFWGSKNPNYIPWKTIELSYPTSPLDFSVYNEYMCNNGVFKEDARYKTMNISAYFAHRFCVCYSKTKDDGEKTCMIL